MTTKRRSANGAATSVAQSHVEGSTVFKLWRDNKIANEYTMTAQEIADRFFASDLFKEWDKEPWKPLRNAWRLWVGCPEKPTEQYGPQYSGLHSVMEDADYFRMDDFIGDEYHRRRKIEEVRS